MKLCSNILEIIPVERLVAFRAETEIFFNPDFSILFDEIFPDISEKTSIVSNKLEVRFMEGYSLMFNFQTGSISRPDVDTPFLGIYSHGFRTTIISW